MISNIISAFQSIFSNKVRSFLTLLGVVIGVASVTILISLGQGLKNDISTLIRSFGSNVIIAVPGKIDLKSGGSGQSPTNLVATDILTEKDVESVKTLDSVKEVTPLGFVTGNVKYKDKSVAPTIFGTYENIGEALEVVNIEKGTIFNSKSDGNKIVLGATTAEGLFGVEEPVGKKITISKEEFEVVGVFSKAKSGGLSGFITQEYDSLSVIPFDTATRLNSGQVKIIRLVAKAKDETDAKEVKKQVFDKILENHNGDENFSVLTQDDILEIFSQILSLITTLISSIAAISLVVGGIGIMNIMLVTVTERTREIGLRKAVGATKFAILTQFLTEAIVITLFGGLIGLAVSFGVGTFVAYKTELTPEITASVIFTALGISGIIGIVFGLWPALRAANKDPIEALRYE